MAITSAHAANSFDAPFGRAVGEESRLGAEKDATRAAIETHLTAHKASLEVCDAVQLKLLSDAISTAIQKSGRSYPSR